MRALLSIHDCAPETLSRVKHLLSLLPPASVAPVTLLVIPGRDWSAQDIEQLRQWQREGHTLAAHGWYHRCQRLGSWYHRLHSMVLSRAAAEHLALNPDEVTALMRKSHDWFAGQGLASPSIYVPPAWALGRVSLEQLQTLPYTWLETTRGFWHLPSGERFTLPLVGYEADTPLRAASLSAFNGLNLGLAKLSNRPLRIGLHPYDDELLLSRSMRSLLARVGEPLTLNEIARPCV